MANQDVILAHHGIKGMKWGVRRKEDGGGSSVKDKVKTTIKERTGSDVIVKAKPGQTVQVVGGNKRDASADAIRARTAQQIAKKSSLDALSNKDLQDLVTRMNLEQQYNQLNFKEGDSRLPAGQKFAKQMVDQNGDKAVKALALNPTTAAFAVPVGLALKGYQALNSSSQNRRANAPGVQKKGNN